MKLFPFSQWFYSLSCKLCELECLRVFRILCWELWSFVKRVKATVKQTHLTAVGRMSNVSSVFKVVQ